MSDFKITDDSMLTDAISAQVGLSEALSLLHAIGLAVDRAEFNTDIEVDAGQYIDELESALGHAFAAIKEGIDDYTSEPAHTEGLETTGRV